MSRRQKDLSPEEELSHTMSYILRHGALKEGLNMGADAFVEVSELLSLKKLRKFTLDDVKRAVRADRKIRFALKTENGKDYVRANQGHTIEGLTELELTKITDPSLYPIVIHGTYLEAWVEIKKIGLSKMDRTHIHFAPGETIKGSVISGMRRNCQVKVYIDIGKAMADGIEFVKSANNVILTTGINGILHPKYISQVLDITTDPPRNLLEVPDDEILQYKKDKVVSDGKQEIPETVEKLNKPKSNKKQKQHNIASSSSTTTTTTTVTTTEQSETNDEKRIKRITKKLREIEELKLMDYNQLDIDAKAKIALEKKYQEELGKLQLGK